MEMGYIVPQFLDITAKNGKEQIVQVPQYRAKLLGIDRLHKTGNLLQLRVIYMELHSRYLNVNHKLKI